MIVLIDRNKIKEEVEKMDLDDSSTTYLLRAKFKAVDIIERLDPDDITCWKDLLIVLENAIKEIDREKETVCLP